MTEEFMMPQQNAREAFTTLISGDDSAIDLVQGALLIAMEEYPGLDPNQCLEQLNTLTNQVRHSLQSEDADSLQPGYPAEKEIRTLRAMNTVLFEQEAFRGNRSEYYDPQNSFLNRVLERRLGIPLTLSLIYIEIGTRLGLHIEGIGMPFHFFVRCDLSKTYIYIDPFEKGKFLSEQACRQRIAQIFKDGNHFDPQWLQPIRHKQFLLRMLANLKDIYIHKADFQRALSVCDRILLLNPTIPAELRDRGIVSFHLKHYSRAMRDLNVYIEMAPDANDLAEIRQQIRIIRQLIAMMN